MTNLEKIKNNFRRHKFTEEEIKQLEEIAEGSRKLFWESKEDLMQIFFKILTK